MSAHPDLPAEQAYIDRAYERLEAMRESANRRLQSALRGRGGTPQAVSERDIVVRSTLQRLEQLDIGGEPLCFGRIDQANGGGDERFYIGRLAVSGDDQEPLVVDWRAPIAEPFYRATGRHPMGLRLRRHFATEGQRIVGIEDEVFSAGTDGDGGDDLELAGPGALLAALERSRSGHMRDIVATVQREQDEIIRAPLAGVLVVQGGPGTGKTAVALHRAAYLLYTHRFPLERQGVLVLGPNPVFLRYIEHVLPSLGETGVSLATADGIVGLGRPTGTDTLGAARVKGDARMAPLLARAVRDRERPLSSAAEVPFGAFSLRFTRQDSAGVVAAARRRGGAHNPRRRQVEAMLLDRLYARYTAALERGRRSGVRRGADEAVAVSRDDFASVIRRAPETRNILDRMWPLLTPQELLHDLFGSAVLVRSAARSQLNETEQAALLRPRSTSLDEVQWTSADLALLDEARVLLGPRRRRQRSEDEVRTYGHIVVDEAQDLSPMQLRALARRSLSGSMTVVGDVAQATGAWGATHWDEVLAHLPARRPPTRVELSVAYRTPAEIMDVAARVLERALPGTIPPRAVRATGERPEVLASDADGLPAAVAGATATMAARIGTGTVAVICADRATGEVEAALQAAHIGFGDAGDDGLGAPVTVAPISLAKGLEFDGVVVVEPSRLVRESSQGLRALFVAVTRATRRLAIVHAEPLPEGLAGARTNRLEPSAS